MANTFSKSAGFTPGPWSLTDRGDLLRIREEASDAVIATTDNGGHPVEEIFDHEQQVANARLIAAAPDLYTALEDCVERLRKCAKLHDNADWAIDAMCEPFETVLAKARAEQVRP